MFLDQHDMGLFINEMTVFREGRGFALVFRFNVRGLGKRDVFRDNSEEDFDCIFYVMPYMNLVCLNGECCMGVLLLV